jgi:putative transposase
LRKAVQFIKGGFSFRAKKELGSNLGIWQTGFSDHRVRDANDYRMHAIYIQQNPVRKGLCERPEQYPYSSASGRFELDGVPQGLKPASSSESCGAPKGAPFQS